MHISAILITALFCSCGNDESQLDIYGSISGQVTNYSTGEPLVNALVTLVPGSNTVQTGNDGSFSFSELDEGQYTVSVQKDGFQPDRKNVTVISSEKAEIVIALKKINND